MAEIMRRGLEATYLGELLLSRYEEGEGDVEKKEDEAKDEEGHETSAE